MATQLVALQEVQRLSPRVIRILAGNPGKFTLQGTNTYLIGTGPHRLLLDTGEGKPTYLPTLQRVLTTETCHISRVLLTHWHPDHVNGVPSLLAAYPNLKIHKHTPARAQDPITDGERFVVEGATLRAVHCPGHTEDHVAFVLEEEDAMFTGDNVLGHGTAVFEDLGTYLKSVQRMGRSFAGRAYPGHGDVVVDGRARIAEYVRHRQAREEQVLQVLRGGAGPGGSGVIGAGEGSGRDGWTSMEIVRVVYKDVPESLHLPANGGVLQVLAKLEAEDVVQMDESSERWRLVKRPSL